MTRPMSDGEICDLIEGSNAAIAEAVDRIEALERRVAELGMDLGSLESALLDTHIKLHDHEQTVPHAASSA